VVAADGFTYEQAAINKRLKAEGSRGGAARSPKTNLPLKSKDLTENISVRILINDMVSKGRQAFCAAQCVEKGLPETQPEKEMPSREGLEEARHLLTEENKELEIQLKGMTIALSDTDEKLAIWQERAKEESAKKEVAQQEAMQWKEAPKKAMGKLKENLALD
jgi:hypothetical protein